MAGFTVNNVNEHRVMNRWLKDQTILTPAGPKLVTMAALKTWIRLFLRREFMKTYDDNLPRYIKSGLAELEEAGVVTTAGRTEVIVSTYVPVGFVHSETWPEVRDAD